MTVLLLVLMIGLVAAVAAGVFLAVRWQRRGELQSQFRRLLRRETPPVGLDEKDAADSFKPHGNVTRVPRDD